MGVGVPPNLSLQNERDPHKQRLAGLFASFAGHFKKLAGPGEDLAGIKIRSAGPGEDLAGPFEEAGRDILRV